MAIRIRYIKDGPETYVSARYIPIGGNGEARVTLSPHTKEGFIHISGRADIRVVGTSLHKIKIAVKKVLLGLGAEFEDEEREERNETSTT